MNKLKIAFVIGMIYFAGIATGVVATRAVVRHVMAEAASNPDRLRTMIERRMAVRLRLNQEQRVKVDEILTRTQNDLKGLREQFSPQFQTIMSNAQAEISAQLTPEQQERFRKFREEHRHLWEAKP
jgi:Spy/CpxP family protein refolding chaperone